MTLYELGPKIGTLSGLPGTAEAGHDDRIDHSRMDVAGCPRLMEAMLLAVGKQVNQKDELNQSINQSKKVKRSAYLNF